MTARRIVLLDLDGTLVDSVADIASSINETLEGLGLPALQRAEVRAMIGDGAAALVQRALLSRGVTQDMPDALRTFRAVYERRCLEETRPYAGIPELLGSLADAGRVLAVVTNKPTAFSERILDGVGLSGRLAAVVGPERAPDKKPSPRHVLAALDLVGGGPGEAVMVGDGPTDVLAGRLAGCATVGVLWGYRPERELVEAGAGALAHDVPELARMLG